MKINYSIIIPIHNSSKFILHLLKTIPRRDDVEVIIVDDYSNGDELKKSRKIISEVNLQNVHFLINKGVNSAGAARNVGIKKARGKYLIFADSDDYFTDDLSLMMDKYINIKVDEIIFLPILGKNSKHERRTTEYKKTFESGDKEIMGYKMYGVWSRFFSSDLIYRNNLFFQETKISNDFLFFTKAHYFAKDVILGEKSIYAIVSRDGSITESKMTFGVLKTRVDVLRGGMEFLKPRVSKKTFRKIQPAQANTLYRGWKSHGIKGVMFVAKEFRGSGIPFGIRTTMRELAGIVKQKTGIKK